MTAAPLTPSKSVLFLSLQETAKAPSHNGCIHSFIQQAFLSAPNHLYLIFNQNNKSIYFLSRQLLENLIVIISIPPLTLVAPDSAPSSPSFLRKRRRVESGAWTANLLRKRSEAASAQTSAGALTAARSPLRLPGTCSAQARNISVCLPSAPHPPSFPLQEAGSRACSTPVRRPEAGLGRRSLHSRKIMYQPGRGAARRLGPCLRAYQALPQVRAEGKRAGRRGGGERPSSEPARGAERAPRSAQAQ